jgi:hypothetical protein
MSIPDKNPKKTPQNQATDQAQHSGSQPNTRQAQRSTTEANSTRPAIQGPHKATQAKIADAVARAKKISPEEDTAGLQSQPYPEGKDLAAMWRLVDEAEQVYRAASRRLEKDQKSLTLKEDHVTGREKDLTEQVQRLKEREDAFAKKERDLGAAAMKAEVYQRSLNEREEYVRGLEAEAEAGFAKRNQEATRALAEQVQSLADAHAGLQKRLAETSAEQVRASEAVWAAARASVAAALAEERASIAEERTAIAEARRALASDRQKLEWERADLGDERGLLADRAKVLAAGEVAAMRAQYEVTRAEAEALRSQRDKLDAKIREVEARARRFGHRTDAEVENLIDTLRAERDELASQLAMRPDRDVVAEAEALRGQCDTLRLDLTRVRRDHEAVKVQLLRADTGVAELEALRDQCLSFKKSNDLLQAANEQLRRDIDQRIRANDGSTPFPACVAMDNGGDDEEVDLNSRRPLAEEVRLGDLVERIRHDAAAQEEPLFYEPEDIRAFLAGMAMTRLTLLQGPSGTGKTSLPIIVAQALGALATIIPAEAGWNDPADLLGHYNQFDRRFDERPLLQALYRAGTPYYEDVPVFIVIDEMNLSHPEQYFSNVISMLEARTEGDRRFSLLPVSADGAPKRFDEGRFLPLPKNVWFVGTANHDETTKDFADKTYDRSQVMELPIQPRPFEVNPPAPLDAPYSASGLMEAFQAARKNKAYAAEADKGWAFLETSLKQPMAERFGVGWGPRLRRQAKAYIPAVIATGGTVGEAVDHLIAMRILRKIRAHHPDDLSEIRKVFGAPWKAMSPKTPPARSLAILAAEERRLDRDSK